MTAEHAADRSLSRAGRWYAAFVLLFALVLVVAAIPIIASDVFRMPYSEFWPVIHRTLDRFDYSYNPPGGGAPPAWPSWRDPADAGLYYRDLRLTTADGLEITAWYVPAMEPGVPAMEPGVPAMEPGVPAMEPGVPAMEPGVPAMEPGVPAMEPGVPAMEPGAPSIILGHGLLGSKWGMLRLIPWLHDAGYNVMLIDFRGHGGSDDRPSTIGREEVLDVQAALDWLEAEGVGNRVAGLGMSLGASALVNTAVQDERLDALVLDSLFADWGDTDYAQGYRLPPDFLVPGVPSPEDLLPGIDVPLFIIHGTADILTHEDHAQRLYDAANEPREIWIHDSGHAWAAWTYPEVYQQKVLDFLDGALGE